MSATASQKLEVMEVGFGTGLSGSIGVVLFKNESATYGADEITIHITAYDSAGHVLASGSTLEGIVRADQTMAAVTKLPGIPAGVIPVSGVAAFSVGTWGSDPHPSALIVPGPSTFSPGPGGGGVVGGNLASHYLTDLRQTVAIAVCHDSSRMIDGGGSTIVDLLPTGGTAAVRVPVIATGTPASCELFATLGDTVPFLGLATD